MIKQLTQLCDYYDVSGELWVYRGKKSKKQLLAEWLIKKALLSGELLHGQAVAEITAGNMGVALARECQKLGSALYLIPIGRFDDRMLRQLQQFPTVEIIDTGNTRSFAELTSMLETAVEEKKAYSFRQFSNNKQLDFYRELLADEVGELQIDCVIDKIGTGATLQVLGEVLGKNGKPPEMLYATANARKVDTSVYRFFDKMPKQVWPKDEAEYKDKFVDVLLQQENLSNLSYANLSLFCAIEWLKENPGKTAFVFIGD